MNSVKPAIQKNLTRRTMLAACSGSALVGLTAGTAVFAKEQDSEVDDWTALIGSTFSCTPIASRGLRNNRRPGRIRVQLVNVITPDYDDPDRPAQFRDPFSLIFLDEGNRNSFQSGTFILSNRVMGRQRVFLNEVMDMDVGVMVIQAVLG